MDTDSQTPVRVYVEVRRGFLVAAYSDAPNIELKLVNWDEINAREPSEDQDFPVVPVAAMREMTRRQFFQSVTLAL